MVANERVYVVGGVKNYSPEKNCSKQGFEFF